MWVFYRAHCVSEVEGANDILALEDDSQLFITIHNTAHDPNAKRVAIADIYYHPDFMASNRK